MGSIFGWSDLDGGLGVCGWAGGFGRLGVCGWAGGFDGLGVCGWADDSAVCGRWLTGETHPGRTGATLR